MTQALLHQRTDPQLPPVARSIALVIPEPVTRIFSEDLFFPNVIAGISDVLRQTQRQLVLMMANTPASRGHVKRFAMAGHLDGVMMASMHGADPLPATLHRMGIPVVVMERSLCVPPTPFVGVDSVAGAAAAAQHLLDRGRGHIATICGPQEMPAGIDRLAGFRQVMCQADRPVTVAAGAFTRESGEHAMRQLLDTTPELDAVFVASDLMALGAVRALRAAGRRVPDDVAVVGFDDFSLATQTDPPLTTVHQPVEELGRMLARQLLRRVAGEQIEDAVVLRTELVVRASS